MVCKLARTYREDSLLSFQRFDKLARTLQRLESPTFLQVLQMPALSPTMSQGNVSSWKVEEGNEIAAGDVLAEIETDKATLEWENQVL